MIPRHVYDRPFTIRLLEKIEWKEGFEPDITGGIIVYTAVSTTNKGIEAGVYYFGRRRKLSFSLGHVIALILPY
jgi:hypothetical protein